jgi:hypothetical protein
MDRVPNGYLCHRHIGSIKVKRILPLLLVLLTVASAASADKVICAKLVDVQNPKSLTDLWQKDMKAGEAKLLVSHDTAPKEFLTRIVSVQPSPDGICPFMRVQV